MSMIQIKGLSENNLKQINLDLPKYQLIVVTGVSGSGKSSLVFDTLASESRRLLQETFPPFVQNQMPVYHRPKVDAIQGLPVAVVIDQQRFGKNKRSTVGTVTEVYHTLRLYFSRVATPFVGYADQYSYNHVDGMCPRCEGLGTVEEIQLDALLDRTKSLNDEHTIDFPTFGHGMWRWKRYALSGLFDLDLPLQDYSEEEWQTFLYAEPMKPPHPLPGWPKSAKFEGLIPRFERSILNRDSKQYATHIERITFQGTCPACEGARLNPQMRQAQINGYSITDVAQMEIHEVHAWLNGVATSTAHVVKTKLNTQLEQLMDAGLGYLTLFRETSTLSGGEAQRVKLMKHMGSSLNDLLYIFDEPTTGLHPSEREQVIRYLQEVRDAGNTVVVVEHDTQVMRAADHLIDVGPGAGVDGGEIVFEGSVTDFLQSDTLTANYLKKAPTYRTAIRPSDEAYELTNIQRHNVNIAHAQLPKNQLVAITGVAGSGKSSFMHAFQEAYPAIHAVTQQPIGTSSRSSLATYSQLLDPIRKRFAAAHQVSESWFSSNSKGACPHCKGKGFIELELAFMTPMIESCEECEGTKFNDQARSYLYEGYSITDVLAMDARQALQLFASEEELAEPLQTLIDVGLDYVPLTQTLSTFSGGELQRLKLAVHLKEAHPVLYLDEPTAGLHAADIEKLLLVFDRLIERGASLFVVEHHLAVIRQADTVLEMGPGAGAAGGEIVFTGTVQELLKADTKTGAALRNERTF